MLLTHCQDRTLTENIRFVWSRTSYSGDKWRCYRCGTNERRRRTREERATQPMEAGWLSFAIWEISKFDTFPSAAHGQLKAIWVVSLKLHLRFRWNNCAMRMLYLFGWGMASVIKTFWMRKVLVCCDKTYGKIATAVDSTRRSRESWFILPQRQSRYLLQFSFQQVPIIFRVPINDHCAVESKAGESTIQEGRFDIPIQSIARGYESPPYLKGI